MKIVGLLLIAGALVVTTSLLGSGMIGVNKVDFLTGQSLAAGHSKADYLAGKPKARSNKVDY
jgi:hypothetical protein